MSRLSLDNRYYHVCRDQRKTFQIVNDHRYFLLINLISFNVLISYTDSPGPGWLNELDSWIT